MGGIDTDIVSRRSSEIEGGSGKKTAIWDNQVTYCWRLSGFTALHRGRVTPIIDGIQQYFRRHIEHKYRRLGKPQAATADFNLKPGINVERLEQPNLEQESLIVVHSMASPRAKHIGPGNLIPRSGR